MMTGSSQRHRTCCRARNETTSDEREEIEHIIRTAVTYRLKRPRGRRWSRSRIVTPVARRPAIRKFVPPAAASCSGSRLQPRGLKGISFREICSRSRFCGVHLRGNPCPSQSSGASRCPDVYPAASREPWIHHSPCYVRPHSRLSSLSHTLVHERPIGTPQDLNAGVIIGDLRAHPGRNFRHASGGG